MPVARRTAVLGDPVDHSYSPAIHNADCRAAGMDDWHYDHTRCNTEELADVVGDADPNFQGFSVTMPGRLATLDLADEISERARLIGSANTLVRHDSNWLADNADGGGVLGTLHEIDCTNAPCGRAVVVGAGGMARPALWALSQLGVNRVAVVAHSECVYDIEPLAAALGMEFVWVTFDVPNLADTAGDADVLVSTVPSAAIESVTDYLARAPKILDVIYNPWSTPLARTAERGGTQAVGGLPILLYQAVGQFEQFTGRAPNVGATCAALPKQLTPVTIPQLWGGE